MDCCKGIEELFSPEFVAGQLKRYRKQGPIKSTRLLINGLKSLGVKGQGLLDIGGGLGAIQHELLAAGAAQAVQVDASSAYLNASEQEARRRGVASRITYHHGNFVDLAEGIPPTEIVTLDRVICCYGDMRGLVSLSAARARRLLGLVYPRNTWWVRMSIAVENAWLRFTRNPFRSYMHRTEDVEHIISKAGLHRLYYRQTPFWQVVIFGTPGMELPVI